MINTILQHKLLTGLVVVVMLGMIVYGVSGSSSPAPLLQTTPQDSSEQQLVATLLTLRAVNLSGTIFQDPVFMSLQDFSTQIQSEPAGRADPFSPLVQTALPTASTSTRQAQIFSKPAKK